MFLKTLKVQLFTLQSLLLKILKKKHFENKVGKEENAGNKHLSFYHMFSKALFVRVVNVMDCAVMI